MRLPFYGYLLLLAEILQVTPIDFGDPAVSKQVQKRYTSNRRLSNKEFIEEKLIEHSQALDYIIRAIDKNSALIKELVENNVIGEVSKFPEEFEASNRKSRRAGDKVDSEDEANPFERFGQDMTRYGRLIETFLKNEFRTKEYPVPLVELNVSEPKLQKSIQGSSG